MNLPAAVLLLASAGPLVQLSHQEQIELPCHHYDYCREEYRGCGGQKADRRGDSRSLGAASQPSPACCWELGLGSGAHEAEACGVL
jgi:hypothetical protein